MVGLPALEAPLHVHVSHDAAHFVQDLPLQLQGDEVWEVDPRMEPHTAMNNAVRDVHRPGEEPPLCGEDAPKVRQCTCDDCQGDVEWHIVHPHIQTQIQGGVTKDPPAAGSDPRHSSGEPLQRGLVGSLVSKRNEEQLINMQDIGSCY